MKKSSVKNYTIDVLFYIAGSIIYSIAIPMFIAPAHISPGGFTGVALILNFLIHMPTGLTILLLNIPLIIISYKKFGRHFIIKTAVATVMVSVILDVSEKFITPFEGDRILSALFGGILIGFGLGLVILRGATTGGVDIIGKLINSKYPHISIGRIILIGDGIVLLLTALCYRDFSGALYSVITIYITSVVLDLVLYGADKGKLIYIITDSGKEISQRILGDLSRGVTKIPALGAYTGEQKEILMCAVRRQEVSIIHSLVKSADENAFIIVCEAGEIMGRGFKE